MSGTTIVRKAIQRIVAIRGAGNSEGRWVPPRLIISEDVCRETRYGLRSHSPPHKDHEGVVYWAGWASTDDSLKVVLSVIVPDATTTPGSYDVSPVANAAVISAVHELDIELIATVHTHPGTLTSHSKLDSEAAQLPHEGYYSIVVPNYAEDGVRPFTDCGVHVYRDGDFIELTGSEVGDALKTIPSTPTYIDTRDQ